MHDRQRSAAGQLQRPAWRDICCAGYLSPRAHAPLLAVQAVEAHVRQQGPLAALPGQVASPGTPEPRRPMLSCWLCRLWRHRRGRRAPWRPWWRGQVVSPSHDEIRHAQPLAVQAVEGRARQEGPLAACKALCGTWWDTWSGAHPAQGLACVAAPDGEDCACVLRGGGATGTLLECSQPGPQVGREAYITCSGGCLPRTG